MQCPNCSTTMKQTQRLGVTIDYCPNCHGVWLDKGELHKIIDRADDDDDDDDNYKYQSGNYSGDQDDSYAEKRKRYVEAATDYPEKPKRGLKEAKGKSTKRQIKSVLEEIFDIFD